MHSPFLVHTNGKLSVKIVVLHVLVVAWARVPHWSCWHSCDVMPEGRRPEGYVTTVPTTPMWSRGKAQATTNLLPFPQQLSVSQENCTTLHNT